MRDAARPAPAPDLSPDEVVEWLRRHPTFIADHPDLFEFLSPPRAHGQGVVELQRFMVERLQGENARLYDAADSLIAMGRSNMAAQSVTHRAALALLEASNLAHLIHIATQDCAEILDVDAITLSVESEAVLPQALASAGVQMLLPGAADTLIGAGRWVALCSPTRDTEILYGPAATLVRSDALARLRFGGDGPWAVLALGARDVEKFQPGQGTDLLFFFARAVEACLKQWLNQVLR